MKHAALSPAEAVDPSVDREKVLGAVADELRAAIERDNREREFFTIIGRQLGDNDGAETDEQRCARERAVYAAQRRWDARRHWHQPDPDPGEPRMASRPCGER